MTPEEAMFEMQELMDGVEWTPETRERIAEILTESGYPVRDLNGEVEDPPEYEEGSYFYTRDPVRFRIPGGEKTLPEGELVFISEAVMDLDSYTIVHGESGTLFCMDSDYIASSLMPVPTVYDCLNADDDNSVMDRYTVFSAGEIDNPKSRYTYLGCSVGGRAVSMWGEVKARDIAGDFNTLGRKVSVSQLDPETQRHIYLRMKG